MTRTQTALVACLAAALLVSLPGCVPKVISDAGNRGQARDFSELLEQVVKANAQYTGYVINPERTQEIADSVIGSFEALRPVECWPESRVRLDPGTFCAESDYSLRGELISYTASEEWESKWGSSIMPMMPWTYGPKTDSYFRSYLVDGLQIMRFVQWEEGPGRRFAVMFPVAKTKED